VLNLNQLSAYNGGQQKDVTHPTGNGGQQKDVTHPTLIKVKWWATKRRYPPYVN